VFILGVMRGEKLFEEDVLDSRDEEGSVS